MKNQAEQMWWEWSGLSLACYAQLSYEQQYSFIQSHIKGMINFVNPIPFVAHLVAEI
jgi:hypothetical protein